MTNGDGGSYTTRDIVTRLEVKVDQLTAQVRALELAQAAQAGGREYRRTLPPWLTLAALFASVALNAIIAYHAHVLLS